MKEAKLMRTKSGNGYKIFVDREWLYAKGNEVERFLNGEITVVTFRTLQLPEITESRITEETVK